ncbi:MAG: hypothetical protein WCD37_04415 [Chloroflexia bacterium]
MPVIINDFEVVAPPPPNQEQKAIKAQAEQAAPPSPPRPEDVAHILGRFAQRRKRLEAD